MTEAEWLTSANSPAMIAALTGKGSERLWRLFAVACVRGVEVLLHDSRSRNALIVAKRFADGTATRYELQAARAQAEAAANQAHRDAYEDEVRAKFCHDEAYEKVCAAMEAADAVVPCVAEDMDIQAIPEGLQLPGLIREVFGNPFQWKLVDPVWLAWHDGAIPKLAQGIYDDRAFDRLPILADALEEARCTSQDILSHCRQPGDHVRGCWVLDLLLGKE